MYLNIFSPPLYLEGVIQAKPWDSQACETPPGTEDWERNDGSAVQEGLGTVRGQGDFLTPKCSCYGSLTKTESK